MAQVEHAPFCLDSLADYVEDGDDFWGDSVDARWHTSGNGSAAVVDGVDGGVVRLTTGAVLGNGYMLSWQDIRSLHVSKRAVVECRVRAAQTNKCYFYMRVYNNSNDFVGFAFFIEPNNIFWYMQTRKAGALTQATSTDATDTNYHVFRIETSATEIHFYIDGVECVNSPITTNIPNDLYLQPHFYIYTNEGVAKSMDIDYVWWRQER